MLEKEGFVIYPYDKCVANKEIYGKQCNVVWYVDDNKISHEDPQVVTDVIGLMKKYFSELTVTRGKKHRFLGMNIGINKDNLVRIINLSCQSYICKITHGSIIDCQTNLLRLQYHHCFQ